MPEGRIIPCTSPEQPGWLSLHLQLWPHHGPEVHLREMAALCAAPERFGQFLFLAPDGETQGFVEVAMRTDYVNGTRTSPVAFLEGIYVIPSARRQGIARMLVDRATQWARERGCSEFASDALFENQVSHAMHRALGFQETERVVYFCKPIR
jgi:aminoglycoside 6'-N-acetyltransferase I